MYKNFLATRITTKNEHAGTSTYTKDGHPGISTHKKENHPATSADKKEDMVSVTDYCIRQCEILADELKEMKISTTKQQIA